MGQGTLITIGVILKEFPCFKGDFCNSIKRIIREMAFQDKKITKRTIRERKVTHLHVSQNVGQWSPGLSRPIIDSIYYLEHRCMTCFGGSRELVRYYVLQHFKKLQLTREKLIPYKGSNLHGFNGSTTRPYGHVKLMVSVWR